MAEKESIFQELPGSSTSLTSLVTEDSGSFYPPVEILKDNASTKLKDERWSATDKDAIISLDKFHSPRSTIKRSKPVEPSQRPVGLAKKLKPENNQKIGGGYHPSHKRPRFELESDFVEATCRMKPKRLKFVDEFNSSFDSIDVNQEHSRLSTTYDDEVEHVHMDESEKEEYEELHLSEIEEDCANENYALTNHIEICSNNDKDYGSHYHGKDSDKSFNPKLALDQTIPQLTNQNEDGCENIVEATEIDSFQQEGNIFGLLSETKYGNKELLKKNSKQMVPPIARKRRYVPRNDDCTIIPRDEKTSEIEATEPCNRGQRGDENNECAQVMDQFSSPIFTGPKKRLFYCPSQASSNITLSPMNPLLNQSRSSVIESFVQNKIAPTVTTSTPATSGMTKQIPLVGNRINIPTHIFDPPRSTSTPRRNTRLPLEELNPEQVGASGDMGFNSVANSSQEMDLFQSQLSDGDGNVSETGHESQPFSSQEVGSSQIVFTPGVQESEGERTSIYYPETSSEPDRHNISGDVGSFMGLEPIYQLTSMYHGANAVSRANFCIDRLRRRQSISIQNNGASPSARRHLNFGPMIDADHEVPRSIGSRSIMDPED